MTVHNSAIVGQNDLLVSNRALDQRLKGIKELNESIGLRTIVISAVSTKKEDGLTFSLSRDTSLNRFLYSTGFSFRFLKIYKLFKSNQVVNCHIYTQFFHVLLIYFLVSKTLKIKTIFHLVENRKIFEGRNILLRLNDLILDRLTFKMDAIVAISSYASSEYISRGYKGEILIIGPFSYLSDKPQVYKKIYNEPFLFYCGNVGYLDELKVVFEAYKKTIGGNLNFKCVINGLAPSEIRELSKKYNVEFYNNLEYEQLLVFYASAEALILPMEKSTRNTYRSPQKICEYMWSARPILLNPVGDLKDHFRDINDCVVEELTVEAWSKAFLRFAEMNSVELRSYLKELNRVYRNYYTIESYQEAFKIFGPNA